MKQWFFRSLILASLVVSARAEEFPLKDAVELHARGGLPNTLAKLEQGGEVGIAFLGGSITAAPGYRPKILAWLKQKFPKATLREINAAIGGTGSDLGAYRVGQDVLQHKPDLMFVEFAVNDGGASPEQIHRTMEGIVRQTWKANPATDIAFVYTLAQNMTNEYLAGHLSRSASAMEDVADHYAIPSVAFGVEVASLMKADKLSFKADAPKTDAEKAAIGDRMIFSDDGVHPHAWSGHELYTKSLARSIEAMKGVGNAGPHALKAPLDPLNWEQAKIVLLTPAMLKGDWKKLAATEEMAKRFAKQLPEMWKAGGPGSAVEFSFRGRLAGFYDIVGPDGGMLEVTVDDQSAKKVARIDGYCTYHRLQQFTVVSQPADGAHKVRVALLAEAPDKAKLLFEKNRPEMEKNPARFAENNWHLGAVLLLGELE